MSRTVIESTLPTNYDETMEGYRHFRHAVWRASKHIIKAEIARRTGRNQTRIAQILTMADREHEHPSWRSPLEKVHAPITDEEFREIARKFRRFNGVWYLRSHQEIIDATQRSLGWD